MTGGGSLAELLDALAPPLEYLAADGFRQAARTRLPLRTLAERVARARADAAPGVDRALGELDEVLAALGQAAPEARAALLRRAHELLPQLRQPGAWTEYRPGAQPVQAALAALTQSVETLRAVGPKRAAELARFGLATVEDVLYHLPFRYEDRRTRTPRRASIGRWASWTRSWRRSGRRRRTRVPRSCAARTRCCRSCGSPRRGPSTGLARSRSRRRSRP